MINNVKLIDYNVLYRKNAHHYYNIINIKIIMMNFP